MGSAANPRCSPASPAERCASSSSSASQLNTSLTSSGRPARISASPPPGRTATTSPPATGAGRHAPRIISEWSGGTRSWSCSPACSSSSGGVVLRRDQNAHLDALPDLSDVQVIVSPRVPGQAPQVVEDQVTYPLTTAMLSGARNPSRGGFESFGASFVYVIFEDGTDIYWARSPRARIPQRRRRPPAQGVTPTLGPDATGVGWVYQYALLAKARRWPNCARSRTGTCATSSPRPRRGRGGSARRLRQTYQVTVDPVKLRSPASLSKVAEVVRDSNRDVGGRVVEMAETSTWSGQGLPARRWPTSRTGRSRAKAARRS